MPPAERLVAAKTPKVESIDIRDAARRTVPKPQTKITRESRRPSG
jgi:hypothetical protein